MSGKFDPRISVSQDAVFAEMRKVVEERDELRAENERLRALIDAVHQHAHLKPGCPLCEALFGAGAQG